MWKLIVSWKVIKKKKKKNITQYQKKETNKRNKAKSNPQTKPKILQKTLEYEPLKEIYVNVLS